MCKISKAVLRKKLLEERRGIPAADARARSESIASLLRAEAFWREAASVFCFISVEGEPDTSPLILGAFSEGKAFYAPRTLKGALMETVPVENETAYRRAKAEWPRRYGIPEGLPTEMVECVFQDSRGFMWFGTEHGVACFDGHTFKTYLANKSLPINKIEENEKGEIVIYGYYFIYVLNTKTGQLRMAFKDDNLNYCVDKSPGLPKGYSLYTKRDVKQLALFRLDHDTLV